MKARQTVCCALGALCAIAAVFCAVQLLSFRAETRDAQAIYSGLRQSAAMPPPCATPVPTAVGHGGEGAQTDVHTRLVPPGIDLSTISDLEDFAFWLDIPGTAISYPVMQGADNAYYLDHMPGGERNRAGSIFLDWRIADGLSALNAVVYGHNMKDGTMFSPLSDFKDASFAADHPYIWALTPEGAFCYEVFSVHEVKATADCYKLDFADEHSFKDFLEREAAASVWGGSGGSRETASHILTLSTCVGWPRDQRTVVHAVLIQNQGGV